MSEETKMKPHQNGDYTNFYVKKKKVKNSEGKWETVDTGIPMGNFVIVKKQFAEGRQINGNNKGQAYTIYSCGVEHDGTVGSFILNENEHKRYAACGGEGDLVKITAQVAENPVTGAEYTKLEFEKVEQ